MRTGTPDSPYWCFHAEIRLLRLTIASTNQTIFIVPEVHTHTASLLLPHGFSIVILPVRRLMVTFRWRIRGECLRMAI